jgi:two-component system phosphate regulon response regulator OmpR
MTARATILIVDDEPDVREVLEEYFVSHGYAVLGAESAAAARELAAAQPIDLALVDINMPGEDGLSLARHLRERYAQIAIVMLTSAATVVDRIVGLEMGADDYVPKPFDPRELAARVKSVLRRTSAAGRADLGAARLRIGRCVLDVDAHRLSDENGREGRCRRRVRPAEGARRAPEPRAFSERILNSIGSATGIRSIAASTAIMRLRKKIEPDPEHPRFIRTVRNEGYIFVPDGREETMDVVPTRHRLYFIACIALSLALGGCMRESESSLRIGTNVWIGSEPLYRARARPSRSCDRAARRVPVGERSAARIPHQAIDGMVISLDELFELAVDGLQPRIILVVDVSTARRRRRPARMKTMRDLRTSRSPSRAARSAHSY